MCGLSFIVDKSLKSNFEKEIYKMNDSIIHRGPDDEGVYFYQNLSFGFRRLSILDLSDLGHQPMLDRNGNVLIFNGEIFNYIELKKQLSDLGCIFKTKTDT